MSIEEETYMGVQVNSDYEVEHNGRPKYVERAIRKWSADWMTQTEPCPISIAIGFPMCIHHITATPEERHGNKEVADLHLITDPDSEDYGYIEPHFSDETWGTVLVLRKDKKDLLADQMKLVMIYCTYIKICLDEDDVAGTIDMVRDAATPQVFLNIFEHYRALVFGRGRGPRLLHLPTLGEMDEGWRERHAQYYRQYPHLGIPSLADYEDLRWSVATDLLGSA